MRSIYVLPIEPVLNCRCSNIAALNCHALKSRISTVGTQMSCAQKSALKSFCTQLSFTEKSVFKCRRSSVQRSTILHSKVGAQKSPLKCWYPQLSPALNCRRSIVLRSKVGAQLSARNCLALKGWRSKNSAPNCRAPKSRRSNVFRSIVLSRILAEPDR